MKGNKQKESPDGDYRCERCWNEDKINLFPRSNFLGDDAKGFIILCEKCKGEAPSDSNEKAFDNLFLRFSSPKEFIQYYNAENKKDAMKKWEREIEGEEVLKEDRDEVPEKESESVGVEDQKNPMGYEMINGNFSVIQNESEIIKKIFESYLSGKTMEKIARELAGKDEEKTWSLNEVREILKEPIYAGYKFQGGDVVKAQHEAIVNVETFNKVQQKIQRNIRNPKYRQNPLVLGD
jgi:hypothetical protein